ncbi:MAG: response regulator transcription factor [Bdellovibrionales bacterium]|nr:response regulator transcription factor [Bdellovibrionales bacterium]
MPEKIRLVLVDEQNICRTGIARLLIDDGRFELVGEFCSGSEVLQLLKHENVDAVITEINISPPNGIELARDLSELEKPPKIIALSSVSSPQVVARFLRAGGSGYVLKKSKFVDLVIAIKSISDPLSGFFISPEIKQDAVQRLLEADDSGHVNADNYLSRREREVLLLISEGKSTGEIAGELGLSSKTVETYRKTLMDKLGLYTVAELTKYALINGIAVDGQLQPTKLT